MMNKLQMNARGKKGEILLYGDIGEGFFTDGITAKDFIGNLNAMGNVSEIDIRVNSPGGDVFEGFSIYNALIRHPAKINVHVDGLAASIASIIAMSGDSINISDNGMMMIHEPWSMAVGDADEFRAKAQTLDKMRENLLATYVSRTGGDRDAISGLMKAETWMTAEEAVSRGFADFKVESEMMAASLNLSIYGFKHTPEKYKVKGTPNLDSARDAFKGLEERFNLK